MDWLALVKQMVDWPIHLSETIHWDLTRLVFCNASGTGAGGVCIDPTKSGTIIQWNHPCLSDITYALVSETNSVG